MEVVDARCGALRKLDGASMKKIVVATATRAEYGLLRPVIKQLLSEKDLVTKVVVTGAHLSPEFGMTVHEIENDQINIEKKIEILLSSDTPVAVSKSMGLALISFAEYFEESQPDALLVLGDRYETLAICCAAMNARVPIFHMYGGETTEGAVDEAIRHSITKMSYLHFTSTERYRKRVIQLGEDPERVYTVGAVGIENALKTELLSQEELEKSLGCKLGECYAIVTFHPVTLEYSSARKQIDELLKVTEAFPNMKFLFTKANADADGRVINACIEEFLQTHNNIYLYSSLGMKRYLSAVKNARMVIGNSSSGLLEVPTFGIPTVNIGDRQKGRIQADSILNCKPEYEDIKNAIEKAMSTEFVKKARTASNPYGDGNTSTKVVGIIRKWMNLQSLDIKKKFFDIDFDGV